jgi:hypothetical protein
MSPKWPLFRENTQVPSPLISSSGIGLAPKWAAASCKEHFVSWIHCRGPFWPKVALGPKIDLFPATKIWIFFFLAAEGCGRVRLAQALHGGRV